MTVQKEVYHKNGKIKLQNLNFKCNIKLKIRIKRNY